MPRRKVRDRLTPRLMGGRTVYCECGARLLELWPRVAGNAMPSPSSLDAVDGIAFAAAEWTTGADDDAYIHRNWTRVVCRRCRRDWQGRQAMLCELIEAAPVGGRVTLRPVKAVGPRAQSTLHW